jgi:anti-sigma regulatory factor (Ser/Thr protein kinase)
VQQALEGRHGAGAVQQAILLTSELVTNAIVHAGSSIELVVRAHAAVVRVEVIDGDPRPPLRRVLEGDTNSGRGLNLVEALATVWGVDHVPGDGKRVWFEVAS